ncbi:Gtr1/RagA G protein Gtr2 [Amanita muscaria]
MFPSYEATSISAPILQRPPINGHGSELHDKVKRTKILLLGLRRSGKTSIQQVIFNNLSPKQTFYLESTMKIVRHTIDTVIPLEVWDTPGNITIEALGTSLSQFSALVFVIDIRDLYNQPIAKLVEFIVAAYHANPNMTFEVFVHKAEKLQEEDKIENFRQIHERVSDRLFDISSEYEQIQLNFHLTSVYDHSLHAAFSRVLHKLIESLPYLEDMLNIFCANSQSLKAFLYDVNSSLYVATDASPVDSATHNLCCEFLQMLNSFGPLYRSATATSARPNRPLSPATPLSPGSDAHSSMHTGVGSSDVVTYDTANSNVSSKPLTYPSAATSLHPSTPGTTLTCHLITSQLALLAILPTNVYEGRRGLVEYNVVVFREGVQDICNAARESRAGG